MDQNNMMNSTPMGSSMQPAGAPEQKSTGLIIGIVIITLVLVGGGYYFWKSSTKKVVPPPVKTETPVAQQQAVAPTPESDVAALEASLGKMDLANDPELQSLEKSF